MRWPLLLALTACSQPIEALDRYPHYQRPTLIVAFSTEPETADDVCACGIEDETASALRDVYRASCLSCGVDDCLDCARLQIDAYHQPRSLDAGTDAQ